MWNSKARPKNISKVSPETHSNVSAKDALNSPEILNNNDLTRNNKSEPVPLEIKTEEISRRQAFAQAKQKLGLGLVKILRSSNLLEQEIKEKIFRP